jgi:hypothetical protein
MSKKLWHREYIVTIYIESTRKRKGKEGHIVRCSLPVKWTRARLRKSPIYYMGLGEHVSMCVWPLDYSLDIPDICLHNEHNTH